MADPRKSVILQTSLGLVFLLSGLVVNVVQAILYLMLYYTNRRLYRRLNYYLIYTSWSQIVAMAEWWSGSSCNLYGKAEVLEKFGKEHCIVVMNHRYDVDWLMCWFVCDKLGMLGSAKSCAKKSLKFIPVIGWSWVFGELVFLERNWDKDRQTLGAKLDKLVEYDDPIMLLLFAEGTRYTQEKHEASLKFADEHSLPKYKYHLLPRAKGFNFSVSHLKSKMNAIYDVQLAFPNDIRPTFHDLLCGKKFMGDMYVRRIPMSEIPTDSNEDTTKFLYDLYRKKDEMMENYLKTSTFPDKCVKMKRSPKSLINYLFWCITVGFPFLALIYKLLFCGNPWVTAVTVVGIVSVFTLMHLMIGFTKADKGSSYGKTSSSPKRNGVTTESVANGECTDDTSLHSENSEQLHKRDTTTTNDVS